MLFPSEDREIRRCNQRTETDAEFCNVRTTPDKSRFKPGKEEVARDHRDENKHPSKRVIGVEFHAWFISGLKSNEHSLRSRDSQFEFGFRVGHHGDLESGWRTVDPS